MRFGLIGYGAIGAEIGASLAGLGEAARLCAVLVRRGERKKIRSVSMPRVAGSRKYCGAQSSASASARERSSGARASSRSQMPSEAAKADRLSAARSRASLILVGSKVMRFLQSSKRRS